MSKIFFTGVFLVYFGRFGKPLALVGASFSSPFPFNLDVRKLRVKVTKNSHGKSLFGLEAKASLNSSESMHFPIASSLTNWSLSWDVRRKHDYLITNL